jgi:EmrB/QacA subfamily drug resistance transporter
MSTSPGSQADAPAAAIDPQLRRMAVVVVLGAIMTILDSTIVNVAINRLATDFGTSLPVIQWTLTGYTLALCTSIPITSWAVRRFGSKVMWTTALTLFIGGSVLCGLSWSVGSLIVFRVVQGLGGGMVMPVGQALLAKAAGPQRMGRVMSVITVPAMLAPVLGPLLGGLIVADLSWRWLFFVNVPLCAAAVLGGLRVLPDDRDRRTAEAFDLTGMLLLSPGLVLLVYGLSQTGTSTVWLAAGAGLGAVLLAVFVVRSVRAARTGSAGLLDVTVLRHRGFSTGMLALFLYTVAIFGLLVMLPIFYQTVQGRSPLLAGMLVAPLGLGAMVTIPAAGKITDRSGPRGVALAGLVVAAVGMIPYTQLHPGTNLIVLAGALFVVGLGHGLISPSLMAAALRAVDPTEVAGATTSANILARLGTSVGTAAFAVILQIAIRANIPGASGQLADAARLRAPAQLAALTGAFGSSLWWALGIAAAAVVPALFIPSSRPAKGQP